MFVVRFIDADFCLDLVIMVGWVVITCWFIYISTFLLIDELGFGLFIVFDFVV